MVIKFKVCKVFLKLRDRVLVRAKSSHQRVMKILQTYALLKNICKVGEKSFQLECDFKSRPD